jgi:hypothetical protein
MTADEIRKEFSPETFTSVATEASAEELKNTYHVLQVMVLGEIAAQLAELNQSLKAVQGNGSLLVTPCQGDEILVKQV